MCFFQQKCRNSIEIFCLETCTKISPRCFFGPFFSYSLEVINSFQQSQHWRLALDLLPSPFASNVATCAALGAAPWPQALQLFVPLAQQRVANLVASTAMAAVCRADAGAVCSEVLAELQGRSVSFLWQKMKKVVIMLRMWSVSKCNGSFFLMVLYISYYNIFPDIPSINYLR